MKLRICRLLMLSIVVAIITSFSYPAWGTDVGGNITEDTTWTMANSPYIVTTTVQVHEGAKLTIDPGVTIRFKQDTGLTIGGELNAIGTENKRIIFTSHQPTPVPGDWFGLKFVDSSVDAHYDSNGNYIYGSIVKFSKIEFGGKQNLTIYGCLLYTSPSPRD